MADTVTETFDYLTVFVTGFRHTPPTHSCMWGGVGAHMSM